MADTRELILNRLLAIATGQAGFESAVRNRGLLTTEKRPAIIVLDGRETPVLTHGGRSNRARNGMSMPLTPSVMALQPEIYILLDEHRPTNENVGTLLNTLRRSFIRALAEDTEMQSLLGANGGIVYNGADTDLKSGGALSGQMRLDFQFSYVFFPITDQQGAS